MLPTSAPASRRPALLLAMTATLAVASGCGEGGVAPSTGSISVTVQTTGAELDPDGYTVSVEGGEPAHVPAAGTVTLTNLAPGVQNVRVDGVRFNCRLTGPEQPTEFPYAQPQVPRPVEVVAGETARTTVVVACGRTGDRAPTWTPDGRLVFAQYADTGGHAVVSVAPRGAGLAVLLQSNLGVRPSAGGEVAISPDGRQIALLLYYYTGTIAIANIDGSGTRTVGSGWNSRCPAWSPDGQRLAYAAGWGNHPSSTILGVNADGTGGVNLSGLSGNAGTGASSDGYDDCPAFTRDGASIVFHHWPGVVSLKPGDVRGVWAMNPDGSNRRLLDSTVRGTGRISISPDGQLWAYTGVARDGATGQSVSNVFVRPAAGGPDRQLTTNGLSSAPAWSPDGRQIAFLAASAEDVYRPRVHVMNADGTGAAPVPTALAP